MKTIRPTETLYYYDGPQVFEARDTIGGHYIGVAVEPDGDEERYLVVGVAPERLWEFRMGLRDLRSLITDGGDGEWWIAQLSGLEEPLKLTDQVQPASDSELLPESGFLLSKPSMPGVSLISYIIDDKLDKPAIAIEGALQEADLEMGSWRLATPSGPLSGTVIQDSTPLRGLKLGSNYRFVCRFHTDSEDIYYLPNKLDAPHGVEFYRIWQACTSQNETGRQSALRLIDSQPLEASFA